MKVRKRRILALFIGMLIVMAVQSVSYIIIEGAKKAQISAKTMTIPIGKGGEKTRWHDSKSGTVMSTPLRVKNKVKGATYTFSSSNTKVVSISKKGGYLTGVKAGTATITVKEIYKKKTKKVGSCKVTVKKVTASVNKTNIAMGSGVEDEFTGMFYSLNYRNPNAKYIITSNSSNFSLKEVKKSADKVKNWTSDIYHRQYTAKKAGTYTLTLKEVYNKKTVKIKDFKVTVHNTGISDETQTIFLHKYMNVFETISYPMKDKAYHFEIIEGFDASQKENSIVELVTNQYGNMYIMALKAGRAVIQVREENEKGKVVGKFHVEVVEIPVEEIKILGDRMATYVGDDWFWVNFETVPKIGEMTDKIKVTSSDSKILSIHSDSVHEGKFEYKVLKSGTVTITITSSSGKKASCQVKVYENKEQYEKAISK